MAKKNYFFFPLRPKKEKRARSVGKGSEDILALSSDKYLRSIEEARSDYKEGKVKSLEEIFDI